MRGKSVINLVALSVLLLVIFTVPALALEHTVKSGESLYLLSRQYGTSITQIKSTNQLKGDVLTVGQKLTIESRVYRVKKGDTLYNIAQRYGTSWPQLKQANGLKSDTLYPGMVLRIPESSTAPARSLQAVTSDDLYWLAKAVYGEARGEVYVGQVAVAAVILNRLADPDFPNTVKGVIFEPLAFTAVQDKQIYLEANATAIKAAREALNGVDPSGGALYYWNPKTATSQWVWSRPIIKTIGNHVFAK